MQSHYDILIIGAGLSGLGAACHLQRELPGKSVRILERRQALGGTWDLFRYPGVRSDSDMFSYAFQFRPWTGRKVLAEGARIRDYLTQTAREYGVDQRIDFGMRCTRAAWSSVQQWWEVTVTEEATGAERRYTCNFLISCSGYYNYDQAYLPSFPGVESFQGQCVHPQFWPEGLDWSGKKVVIIGSGATAVTLLPAMAEKAAQVTMLQRSPTYMLSISTPGAWMEKLDKLLPQGWVPRLMRRFYIGLQRSLFKTARRWPQLARRVLLAGVRKSLPQGYDLRHFTPRYKPWDERLCVVPDADLFKAIRNGKASVVTDHIERFTPDGILLQSGATLQADLVVTATGLQLQTLGGLELYVDGQPISANTLLSYRAVLLQNVPNFAFMFGYTNASWTLKTDMASRYLCRLMQYMDQHGLASAIPRAPATEVEAESLMASLGSGYIRRAHDELPRQGRTAPWRVTHALEEDRGMLLGESIDDGRLEFVARQQTP